MSARELQSRGERSCSTMKHARPVSNLASPSDGLIGPAPSNKATESRTHLRPSRSFSAASLFSLRAFPTFSKLPAPGLTVALCCTVAMGWRSRAGFDEDWRKISEWAGSPSTRIGYEMSLMMSDCDRDASQLIEPMPRPSRPSAQERTGFGPRSMAMDPFGACCPRPRLFKIS